MSLYDQFMYGVLVLKVYRRLGCMQISTKIYEDFVDPLVCAIVWRKIACVHRVYRVGFIVLPEGLQTTLPYRLEQHDSRCCTYIK